MRGVTPFLIPLSYARRDAPYIADKLQAYISTHTPHARRDWTFPDGAKLTMNFNSHASCEA